MKIILKHDDKLVQVGDNSGTNRGPGQLWLTRITPPEWNESSVVQLRILAKDRRTGTITVEYAMGVPPEKPLQTKVSVDGQSTPPRQQTRGRAARGPNGVRQNLPDKSSRSVESKIQRQRVSAKHLGIGRKGGAYGHHKQPQSC